LTTQISPNPNAKGNVIAIEGDQYNSLDVYENDGTIAVAKTGSLTNKNGVFSSGVEDAPAGPGGNVYEPGQIQVAGSFINNDTINTWQNFLNNGSTINNANWNMGQDVGTITNNGKFENYYILTLGTKSVFDTSGDVFNGSEGGGKQSAIIKLGTDSDFINDGTVTNYGEFNFLTTGAVIDTTGGTLTNANGGSITGSGTIKGTISSSGALKAGNSAGGLMIEGSLTHKENGIKEIELGGDFDGDRDLWQTQYDFIDVTGDLILDGGTLDVKLIDSFELRADQAFVIAKVGGDLMGEYNGLENGALVGEFNAAGGGMIELFVSYDYAENEVTLFTK
jgi:hypothetical protein